MSFFANTFAIVGFGITAIELKICTIRIFHTHRLFYTLEKFFVANGLGIRTIRSICTFHLFASERRCVTDVANFLAVFVLDASDTCAGFGIAVWFSGCGFAAVIVGTRRNTTAPAIAGNSITRTIQRRFTGFGTCLTHTVACSTYTFLFVRTIVGFGASVGAVIHAAVVLTGLFVRTIRVVLAGCPGTTLGLATSVRTGLIVAAIGSRFAGCLA